MNRLHAEIIRAVMTKMFEQGHFSICEINNLLKMTGGVPDRNTYNALNALHCVNFKDMSPMLRVELPRLVQVVLESQPMRYEISLNTESQLLP